MDAKKNVELCKQNNYNHTHLPTHPHTILCKSLEKFRGFVFVSKQTQDHASSVPYWFCSTDPDALRRTLKTVWRTGAARKAKGACITSYINLI